MTFKKIKLLFHTIKHLRYEQILYRVLYRFKKPQESIRPSSNLTEIHDITWNAKPYVAQCVFSNGTAKFLGEIRSIANSKSWNDQDADKLWLYNLHYFDDLNAIDFQSREVMHWGLLDNWIADNQFGYGNGWEPYPLSLRIVNLVKWFSNKDKVDEKYLQSLTTQADALSQQIEYHILGNHIFANAKALIFFGAFIKSDFAKDALVKGVRLLNRELDEQFLNDGAHFELSPMYHCILVWDLLELINLSQLSKNELIIRNYGKWTKIVKKGLSWLETMLHPDKEISFFNDAAIGIAPAPSLIFEYAKVLGVEFETNSRRLITNLESGYSAIKQQNYTLIFDHANVGPDYLPGHAHADTLSFEMSVGNQRVFVNSGTSLYGVSAERLRQRKTAAHNTVLVEGEDSSEVWSGFRVAKRAYAHLLESTESSLGIVVAAYHDGYKRLKNSPIVTRTLVSTNNKLIIKDELSIKVNACFNLHIHPLAEIIEHEGRFIVLRLPSQELVEVTSTGTIDIESSTWHPNFGRSEANKKIIVKFQTEYLETQITIMKNPN